MTRLLTIFAISSALLCSCTGVKQFAYPVERPVVPILEVCSEGDEDYWTILEEGEDCDEYGLQQIGVYIPNKGVRLLHHYISEMEIRLERCAP